MKKFFKFVVCSALLVLGLTACSSGDNTTLTSSAAEKAIKKTSLFAKDSKLTKFQTGYYEIPSDQLDAYAQLKAANLITLKVDELSEYKVERWTRMINIIGHYFVTVELTEEGKKFERPEYSFKPDHLQKYLNANEEFVPTYPEYMSTRYVFNAESDEDCGITDEDREEMQKLLESLGSNNRTEREDENAEYKKALANVKTEDHMMLIGQCKLTKAYEVKTNQTILEIGTGSCKFIYEITDITPFGYIFYNIANQKYWFGSASFTRYEDLGWIVTEINDKE